MTLNSWHNCFHDLKNIAALCSIVCGRPFWERPIRQHGVPRCNSTILRRDCLGITGIPVIPLDNPNRLVVELFSALDIDLNEQEISTAHRLPATKKVKERIIVKFVRRDKRNETQTQCGHSCGRPSPREHSERSNWAKNLSQCNYDNLSKRAVAMNKLGWHISDLTK